MADEQDESSSKKPAVFGFVRTIANHGLEDPNVRERIKGLSYMEIAALRDHPKFQDLLAGIVLKRALLGEKIPTDMRWALRYLTSRRLDEFDENGNALSSATAASPSEAVHMTPKTFAPITVQPLAHDA